MTISASRTSSTAGVPLQSPDLHNITIKYLEKHLTPQDIQFINVRGMNGKPDWGMDLSGYKRTVIQSAVLQEATGTLLRPPMRRCRRHRGTGPVGTPNTSSAAPAPGRLEDAGITSPRFSQVRVAERKNVS
jgi:hypothetical protein